MPVSTQHVYRSANGDRWLLFTDTASGRKFVRHEANQSSGGHATDLDVEDFLEIGGSGPEFAALRDLMGRPSEDARNRVHEGRGSILSDHVWGRGETSLPLLGPLS